MPSVNIIHNLYTYILLHICVTIARDICATFNQQAHLIVYVDRLMFGVLATVIVRDRQTRLARKGAEPKCQRPARVPGALLWQLRQAKPNRLATFFRGSVSLRAMSCTALHQVRCFFEVHKSRCFWAVRCHRLCGHDSSPGCATP